MAIRWDKLMENEKRQFEKMTELKKFIYFLLLQFGSPYGWGKENPVASDCSGAVCMALYAATGYLIRITADELYKRVFTIQSPKSDQIRAVFFVSKKNQKHGESMVTVGSAIHVAGIIEDGIILNSQEPYAKLRRINDISDWYQNNGFEVVIRGLNREALKNLADKNTYELDKEFHNFFTTGG